MNFCSTIPLWIRQELKATTAISGLGIGSPIFPFIPVGHGEYLMQMAVGYFDESSDEFDEGTCYCVAGFIGSQHATVVLGLRWKDLLDEYELRYFKASELNAGEGEFKKFRDDPSAPTPQLFSPREKEKFKEVKTRFTDVIVGCRGLYAIGATVLLRDLKLLREDYPKARLLPFAHYIAMGFVLMEAGQQMRATNANTSSGPGYLKPIFDSHEIFSGKAKETFDSFCQRNPVSAEYLLPPNYESEKRYLPLQAADNIAYEIRRKLVRDVTGVPVKERVSMERLRESVVRIYKLDYNGLKIMADAQERDVLPPVNPAVDGPLWSMRDMFLEADY